MLHVIVGVYTNVIEQLERVPRGCKHCVENRGGRVKGGKIILFI